MRIYSRPRKNSRQRSWYIDYRDPVTGKRIRKVCGITRKEAEKCRARIEAEIFNGDHSTITPENPPFYKFMQEYMDHLGATGITYSSLKRYKQILQNFIDFFWQEKNHVQYLSDISTKDIWDYIHYRKKNKIKDKTISSELTEIKKCFRYAVEISAIVNNPAQAVSFKQSQASMPHFFTKDEIKKIFKALPKEWMRDIFRTLLYTGMRKGELMHLLWKDIDFDRRPIHIRHQVVSGEDVVYKTKQSQVPEAYPCMRKYFKF